jgi:predicted thioesterase
MGESSGFADDDTDARASVASGAQLLDSAVVEPGRRGPPVLDEDLREVTAGTQCRAENALNCRGIEHRAPFAALRTSFRRPTATAYRNSMPPQPGLAAEIVAAVTESDTAVALGSGEVPVLGTPRVVALCEEASVKALESVLDPGTTSVGMRIQLDHVAPTAVGHKVRAEATLERVEGRRLTFSVSMRDERGLVAVGKVTRVLVDIERFLDKCR